MYHNVDRLVGQAEEKMRLDDLERLVHQRRRIDGDLLPHLPGGMAQRLVHRGVGHAGGRRGAERATRRREDQARHLGRLPARDALQCRAVLGVDRHHLAAALARRARHELARHNQGFLVRQGHPLAGPERRQRRLEPRRPHDPVHHDLHVRPGSGLDETVRPPTLAASGFPLARARALVPVHEADVTRAPLRRLAREQVRVRVRGQGRDVKPFALAREDLERGLADRAGRPEDRNPDTHATPNSRNSPAVTGRTKYRESRRSRTPPCPGMSVEESFTPASRLKRDSATSPTAATTAPTTPPIAPAHVFRGDKTGASFGPPTSVPAAIAAVSHTQVRTSGSTARAKEPRGCASLCGPCRIATRNASSIPAYSVPKIVTATASSGCWAGVRVRTAPTRTSSSQIAAAYSTGSESA